MERNRKIKGFHTKGDFFSIFHFLLRTLDYFFVCLFKSRPTYQVQIKNEVGVCQRLVCQKREFAVRSHSCEV